MYPDSCFGKVYVKVINLETGHEFEWTKETFLNRLYLMKEMYQNYESEDMWDVPPVSFRFQIPFINPLHPILFSKSGNYNVFKSKF